MPPLVADAQLDPAVQGAAVVGVVARFGLGLAEATRLHARGGDTLSDQVTLDRFGAGAEGAARAGASPSNVQRIGTQSSTPWLEVLAQPKSRGIRAATVVRRTDDIGTPFSARKCAHESNRHHHEEVDPGNQASKLPSGVRFQPPAA